MNLRLFPILMLVTVFAFITACTTTDDTTTASSTTTITSFSLKNDRVTGLSTTKFIIDSDSNVIYNVDSLPYLSDVDSLIPTIYGATLSAIYINDTILYTGKDTIDCTKPVTISTIATDKTSTQKYTVKVNVHQVDPDLYFWTGVKSEIYQGTTTQQKAILFNNKLNLFVKTDSEVKLYQSVNGQSWTEFAVTGLPFNCDIDGLVNTKEEIVVIYQQNLYRSTNGTTWTKSTTPSEQLNRILFNMNDKLYALGTTNGTNRVIFESSDQINWVNLGIAPEEFPVTGFTVWVDAAPSGKMHAFVLGGRTFSGNLLSSVWSTENGTYWANLTAEKEWFTPREKASVIQYGDGLMMIGGSNGIETLTDKQWFSPDYGLTWKEADNKAKLPDLCIPRFGQSVIVDEENYIYIIGGQTSSTFLRDIWKGRKNSAIPGFLD